MTDNQVNCFLLISAFWRRAIRERDWKKAETIRGIAVELSSEWDEGWRSRRDSNPQPFAPKANALSD